METIIAYVLIGFVVGVVAGQFIKLGFRTGIKK